MISHLGAVHGQSKAICLECISAVANSNPNIFGTLKIDIRKSLLDKYSNFSWFSFNFSIRIWFLIQFFNRNLIFYLIFHSEFDFLFAGQMQFTRRHWKFLLRCWKVWTRLKFNRIFLVFSIITKKEVRNIGKKFTKYRRRFLINFGNQGFFLSLGSFRLFLILQFDFVPIFCSSEVPYFFPYGFL